MGSLGIESQIAGEKLVQVVPIGCNVDQVMGLHHFLHGTSKVRERVRRIGRNSNASSDDAVGFGRDARGRGGG